MPHTRLAEERKLDVFVGNWENEGVVHPGRFGSGGKSTGKTTYQWEMNGKWLMYDSRLQLPEMGAYQVKGGVSYDAQTGTYRAFAFNSLRIHLVYEGYWENETHLIFDLTHPAPSQGGSRVVYILFSDGTFQMNSESSDDGENYSPYFETKFRAI